MEQQIVSIPLPHEQREQVAFPFAFQQRIVEHGFTITQTRNVYTDPDVFRQQWLVRPNGAYYSGHTFYRFFGSTAFRKLLRHALSQVPCIR